MEPGAIIVIDLSLANVAMRSVALRRGGIRYSPENRLKRPSRKTHLIFAVSTVIRYTTVRYRKSSRKMLTE